MKNHSTLSTILTGPSILITRKQEKGHKGSEAGVGVDIYGSLSLFGYIKWLMMC